MSIDKGMFNFQGVMNQFYGYQPGKDDTEGRAIKNNFQANMIQSGFDGQMAKDMAHTQSQIAQSNMTHAADLEARNTSSNMAQEFNYGMQSMGAQFEFQDKFANNQYDRDLGTLGATGEQERLTIGAKGSQDRLSTVTAGEQNRLGTVTAGEQNRLSTVTAGEQQRETMQEENRLQAKTRASQSSYANKGARNF
jgi:hypothetical protein